MIKRIVLTGGPSSGKTSVLEKIEQIYSAQGYRVILVDETATYLINKGIKPFGEGKIDMVDFQELVLKLQLAKESVIERAAEMMDDDRIIIVYDRGAIDNRAYINDEEFKNVLTRLNNVVTIKDLMDKYDLVINLVGCKEFYTTDNNAARSEDSDTALKLGEVTLRGWLGHKNIRIVYPKETLDEKIKEVLNIINGILEEKEVINQEKYLVDLKNSDIESISSKSTVFDIVQTYLISSEGEERRLRKVILGEDISYYFSVFKVSETGKKTIVSEKKIERKIYDSLLEFRDKTREDIVKKRYYFVSDGEYLHLDIFDGDDEIGILEINVNRGFRMHIPNELKVIDKVSGNKEFSNRNLAKKGAMASMVKKYD
jgi:predicted ATPase